MTEERSEKFKTAPRMPEAQGEALSRAIQVPAGWKATAEKPIPVARCRMVARSTGKRCNRWGLRGTTKVVEMDYGDGLEVVTGGICQKHGGSLPSVKEAAAAQVEAARLRLIGMADEAVNVIEDIAMNGTAENTRLKAATEILDRAGVRTGVEIDFKAEINQGETAAERTMKYLEDTARRLEEAKKAEEAPEEEEEDVVDAELVEDDE